VPFDVRQAAADHERRTNGGAEWHADFERAAEHPVAVVADECVCAAGCALRLHPGDRACQRHLAADRDVARDRNIDHAEHGRARAAQGWTQIREVTRAAGLRRRANGRAQADLCAGAGCCQQHDKRLEDDRHYTERHGAISGSIVARAFVAT
jgi:hypothetical protein